MQKAMQMQITEVTLQGWNGGRLRTVEETELDPLPPKPSDVG